MKKWLQAVLAALLVLGLTACGGNSGQDEEPGSTATIVDEIKERGYLLFGTSPDYAPNEFYIRDPETGEKKIVGSDIALGQAIADELGVELRIVESDFNTVILNAQSGEIDVGISGFAWTQERDGAVDFSDDYSRAASDSYQGFMVRKEDVEKYSTKEKFKESGGTVGAQTGSIQYAMALTITDEAHIVQIADTGNNALQLSSGDIDGFVCTSPQAKELEKSYDNIVLLPQETWDMDPDNFYDRTGAIFSKDAKYDALEEVVNKVIADAKVPDEDGKTLLDKWYDEAVALQNYDITEEVYGSGE